MKKEIPYKKIDIELRELIKVLNNINCIFTIGCCIGHTKISTSDIFFKVTDIKKWDKYIIKLLELNYRLKESNIDIYEWHRLDSNKNKIKDWVLKLEVHPRNEEANESEEDRVLRIKKYTIQEIIKTIEKAGREPC